MAKKAFTYHGYEIEELEKKSLKELIPIMPSRIRRSLKRGLSEPQKIFLKKLEKAKKQVKEGKNVKPIKTHCRDMVIVPAMVNKTIMIHKGKEFVAIIITPEMVGHRLGEFALTRKSLAHSSPGVGATKSSSSASVR